MKVEEEEKKKAELMCTYKGKHYQLLYVGKTRARTEDGAFLMFFNGTKKFWVDASKISQIEPLDIERKLKYANETEKPNMFISDNEAAALVNAVNSEITVYRNVSLKKAALSTDKKLAQEKLKVLLKLKEKLAKL
jgi:hypothetical protein